MEQQQSSIEATPQTPLPSSPSKNYLPLIIGGILFLILLGGVSYFLGMKSSRSKVVVISPTSIPTLHPTNLPTATVTVISDQTADWKTYTNNTFHFSFKYLPDWTVRDFSTERTMEAQPYDFIIYKQEDGYPSQNQNASWVSLQLATYDMLAKFRSQPYNEKITDEPIQLGNLQATETTIENKVSGNSLWISGKLGDKYFALHFVSSDPNGIRPYFERIAKSLTYIK